ISGHCEGYCKRTLRERLKEIPKSLSQSGVMPLFIELIHQILNGKKVEPDGTILKVLRDGQGDPAEYGQ
ncbi:MAG TPA: hypothetical protein DDW42_02580, partial [Desulfobacteraceae bacterium]|nr:hypothetical protein [Desulfobacteraceae bacterium]